MTDVEPFDIQESIKEIRNKAMFPILEIIPLLEKEISKRVYGNVMVMMGSNNHILIRIRNSEFVFGYEIGKEHIYERVGIVIDDCMYKYQQEILKRYIRKEVKP
jgi:hypothetical protein